MKQDKRLLWAEKLGIPASYGQDPYLPCFAECDQLVEWGQDCFGRPARLHPTAGAALNQLLLAANQDGITLQLVSAFRSLDYQGELIQRKLSRGLGIEQVLEVNVAPGFSEHHTGLAVDLTCPGEEPLEESFELTSAFGWLTENAQRFGFELSYPRNNSLGVIYEPWHWCYRL